MSNLVTKKVLKRQANGKVISAVFENGVLKPLAKISLPTHQQLTVIVRSTEKSISKKMYGLLKPDNSLPLDKIIESEDWL